MNSLNLLSAKVIGSPITRARTKSQSEAARNTRPDELLRGRSQTTDKVPQVAKQEDAATSDAPLLDLTDGPETPVSEGEDEKQLLLRDGKKEEYRFRSRLHAVIKKIADALTAILAIVGMPVVYIARRFQDESGNYSALAPFKRKRRKAEKTDTKTEDVSEKPLNRVLRETKLKHSYSSDSLSSMNTDSDSDRKRTKDRKTKKQHLEPEDLGHRRRSSRIRLLQNDDVTQRRKSRLADSAAAADASPMTVENIKSPMSASSANKLKYPHAPQPPRPLIPRRQPSYSNLAALSSPSGRRHSHNQPLQQKTLILDLDETLIHSIAKGSRMSSGHMVEVKLNNHVFNPVAQVVPGQPAPPPQIVPPQHPILYYVHKRPHCDDFLRKVCKWYKVVIFTASVQEYADPVVDWLEQEKKYFTGRYYRQHCTFRNGAYIKDLSSIEPDLSKVIILDNSPISYIFHEGKTPHMHLWS